MTGITGLSANYLYAIESRAQTESAKRLKTQRESAQRQIDDDLAYVKKRGQQLTSFDDLVNDTRLYNIVLKTFGLEAYANDKATIRKVLTEDPKHILSVAYNTRDGQLDELAKFFQTNEFNGSTTSGWRALRTDKLLGTFEKLYKQAVDDDLVLANNKKDLTRLENSRVTEKAVADFTRRASKVKSADDLLKDRKLLQFVLDAFGLGTEVNKLGILRKLLKEDPSDSKSLANQLQDTRYKEFATFFNFAANGTEKLNNASVQQNVISRYYSAQYQEKLGERSEAVRAALVFKERAPKVENMYQVMADAVMTSVVVKATYTPQEYIYQEVDAQARTLSKVLKISNLKSPAYVEKFIGRYLTAVDQAQSTQLSGAALILESSISGVDYQSFYTLAVKQRSIVV